jgi:hypothetical protein
MRYVAISAVGGLSYKVNNADPNDPATVAALQQKFGKVNNKRVKVVGAEPKAVGRRVPANLSVRLIISGPLHSLVYANERK